MMAQTAWRFPARFIATSLVLGTGMAGAQIVPDGTLSNASIVDTVGSTTIITGGTRPAGGLNLFHSFDSFSVPEDTTAEFQNNPSVETANIISRITGGTGSDISGTLRTSGFGPASLYFINPAGIFFGEKAELDLEGSFHVSTAGELRFGDAGTEVFSAIDPSASTLSVAPVSSFGFLQNSPNGVLIETSLELLGNQPRTLSIIAGGITSDGQGQRIERISSGNGGQINLVSVSGPGSVAVSNWEEPPKIEVTATAGGRIDVREISASGLETGAIQIWGGDVDLSLIGLRSDGGPGQFLDVHGENVTFAGNGAPFAVEVDARSGEHIVHIEASEQLSLIDSGILVASESGGGSITLSAPDILIDHTELRIVDGIFDGAFAPIIQIGSSGDLVTAETVRIINGSEINADSTENEGAAPGSIEISALSTVLIEDSLLDISGLLLVPAVGAAEPGNISISSPTVNLTRSILTTALSSDVVYEQYAGDIVISASDIAVSDTQIRSSGDRGASSGDIELVGNTILIDNSNFSSFSESTGSGTPGAAGAIALGDGLTSSIDMLNSSLNALNRGDAGAIVPKNITLSADSILLDTSEIVTDVQTGGQGNDIELFGNTVYLTDSFLSLVTDFGAESSGTVFINGQAGPSENAEQIHLFGSTIQATRRFGENLALGDAIVLRGSEVLVGQGSILESIGNANAAGGISITSDLFAMDASRIVSDASLSESFRAGTIEIESEAIRINGSLLSIRTQSDFANEPQGSIQLIASNASTSPTNIVFEESDVLNGTSVSGIHLSSTELSSETGGKASAGNISLLSPVIRVDGGEISASTNGVGDAGSILLENVNDPFSATPQLILLTSGAVLATTAGADGGAGVFGNAGEITLLGANSPGGVVSLQGVPGDEIEMTSETFAGAGQAGTLSVVGTDLSIENAVLRTTARTSVGSPARLNVLATGRVSLSSTDLQAQTISNVDGGQINIAGNSVLIDSGTVDASTMGFGNAGSIVVGGLQNFPNNLDFRDDEIVIHAAPGAIDLIGGTELTTTASGMGNLGSAGTVSVMSDATITLLGDPVMPVLISSANATGSGQAGSIVLQGIDLISRGVEISTETNSADTAVPAQIALEIANVIQLENTDILASTTGTTSAGNILLSGNSLSMDGGSIEARTQGGSGLAGDIVIAGEIDLTLDDPAVLAMAGSINLSNGADIRSDASGSMPGSTAGRIRLAATDSVSIRGNWQTGTDFSLLANDSDALAEALDRAFSEISSSADENSGGPRSIEISGSSFVLENGSLTTTTAASAGSLAANINVSVTGDLKLDNAAVLASTSGLDAAGNITLSAGGMITMTGGLTAFEPSTGLQTASIQGIESTSAGLTSGPAGSINLSGLSISAVDALLSISTASQLTDVANSQGQMVLDFSGGAVSLTNTVLQSSTTGVIDAADILITAAALDMIGGSMEAITTGSGDAGRIEIGGNLSSVILAGGARIETSAQPTLTNIDDVGDAGTILVNAGSGTVVLDGTISTPVRIASTQQGLNGAAGSIELVADELILNNSEIVAETASANDGAIAGSIALLGGATVLIDNTAVRVVTSNAASAGSITISADGTLSILDGAAISASTSGAGDAGTVDLAAMHIDILDSLVESESFSSQLPGGSAGAISIFADTLDLARSSITTATGSNIDNTGREASILIDSGSDLLLDAMQISADTSGAANAGAITLTAPGDVDLVNGTSVSTSSNSSGAAGSIRLGSAQNRIANLNIDGGSVISVDASGSGTGGSVDAYVENLVLIYGDDSALSSQASGEALGGALLVDTLGDIELLDGATITADASGAATGGVIQLMATGDIRLSNAAIQSESSETSLGGEIRLTSASLVLENGAKLNADTSSDVAALAYAGNVGKAMNRGNQTGGNISISASEGVEIRLGSSVSSNATGNGDGGTIEIAASDLILAGQGRIESTATGLGASGAISVDVQNNLTLVSDQPGSADEQTAILTQAQQSTGGAISLRVGGRLQLANSRIESSVESASGAGGDIAIETTSLLLQQSQILARADEGNGGAITISRTPDSPKGVFLLDSSSTISAASRSGVSGVIDVESPDTNLNSVIQPQLVRIVGDRTLSADACSNSARTDASTLVADTNAPGGHVPDSYLGWGSWDDVTPQGRTVSRKSIAGQNTPLFASAGCAQ